MEQSQHQQRHTADQEFQQSLDELQHILQEDSTQEQQTSPLQDHKTSDRQSQTSQNSSAIDLDAWEDAVADIEQYLQRKDDR